MVVTSQELGIYERLAKGRYSAIRHPAVEPTTCWLQVHYIIEPHKFTFLRVKTDYYSLLLRNNYTDPISYLLISYLLTCPQYIR